MAMLYWEKIKNCFEDIFMGYVFLAISLICGATKGYCGKKTSGRTEQAFDAVCANLLRMFLCIAIGFFSVLLSEGFPAFRVSGRTFAICFLSGLATSVMVVSWLLAVKKGAYMMLDVFRMLGFTVPIAGSVICFSETVSRMQFLGMALLVAATLVMCSYNNSIKSKLTLGGFALLFLTGFSNGAIDFSQKLFTVYAKGVPTSVFNFYTYLCSFLILLVCLPFFGMRKGDSDKSVYKALKPIFGYIGAMSVCLFLHSFTKTIAAHYLPSAALYPLANGCALMLSTIMSAVFFKEKLTAKCLFGVLLAFGGILAVNL